MTGAFWRSDIDPAREPHTVTMRREKLTDAARADRVVPLKIYIPDVPGPLPLILWSHGLGGGADGAAFLSRFLAGQGFVVVHVQHAGTDTGLWEGKPGHPWDVIRATKIPRSAALARFADIPFVLDRLARLNLPALDSTSFGMSGHSFGALTTQVMAGQLYPDEQDNLQSLREPRFKCGILYSPVPMGHLSTASPAELYGPIALPLLHMTGTMDASPIENFGYEQRLAVFENARGAQQNLLVLNDGDHMVYNGSRGKLADNPHRAAHEEIIKIMALAYWNAHLKQDAAALTWLSGTGVQDYLADRGTYR